MTICPHCGGAGQSNGAANSRSLPPGVRYRCKSCRRAWTVRDGKVSVLRGRPPNAARMPKGPNRYASPDGPGMRMVLAVLSAADAPMHRKEIERATGLAAATVRQYTNALLAAEKVHVGGWYSPPNGGAPHPLFTIGKGYKARKPAPRYASSAEKCAAWRARKGRVRGIAIRANRSGRSMLGMLAGLLTQGDRQ